jgi:N-acetylneuraminate lyase
MSKKFWMDGLVPATFTPMHADGSLNLAQVPAIVERLVAFRVMAMFACGTTGECSSMTTPERKATLEAYVKAAAGRVPVVAHVGHTAIAECRDLASHAEKIGAAAVATTPPFYFKPGSIAELVDCMADIAAAAPKLPFYYYHIPSLTGVAFDMEAFLQKAADRIPNLAGIKYTAPTLYDFQACAALENGRFNMVFGTDEMLLAALATGAEGAVGSTYNLAAPLYHKIREHFDAGRIKEAQALQLMSVQMVNLVKKYRPLPALKSMMKIAGIDCGPTRRPLVAMRESEIEALRASLAELGFLEWMLA